MKYAYPCNIIFDHEEKSATGDDGWVVSFPEVPEALTGGGTWAESLALAEDCLAVALGSYIKDRQSIPVPSPLTEGQVLVPVPLLIAAKLTLYGAMREQEITQTKLAKRLGVNDREVRRMLDPGYKSHITKLERAVRAAGQTLVVETMA
jgi:antitoxin HicB